MAEVLLNNPLGVELTSTISPTDTTIHVSQALGSVGETFRLRVGGLGGELMLVSGGAGTTTLGVTRGIESPPGAPASTWQLGTAVDIAATAGAFNSVISEAIPSSLPPSGAAGGDLAGTYPNPTLAATSNVESIIRANRLDQLAPPTGPVAFNGQKITGLANGTASSDAAAFGQIPTSFPPSGAAGGDLTGTYPNPGVGKVAGVAVSGTPSSGQVLTATSPTAADWQTPASGSGSGILASLEYGPASGTGYDIITGTPHTPIDSTNLTIPFVAPASGKVVVMLSGCGDNVGSTDLIWGLSQHGGSSVGLLRYALGGVGQTISTTLPFLITGLTPGNSYQLDWTAWLDATPATFHLSADDGVSGDFHGPLTMVVFSA